jgi:hypothetical protein
MALDRVFRDSAMMPQPILELGNSLIDPLRDARRDSLYDATLDQEANKPACAARVFGRNEMMLTIATTFASMSRKLRNGAVIDVDKDHLRPT